MAIVLLVGGCRQGQSTLALRAHPRQVTLAVGAEPDVPLSTIALVRLVAEQEIHLAREPGGPPAARASNRPTQYTSGVLTLILERQASQTADQRVRRRAGTTLHLGLFLPTRSLESRFDLGRCCGPARVAELRRQLRLLLATAGSSASPGSQPLWPGSPLSRDGLNNALAAGAHWLLARAQATDAFELSDLQQVFLILRQSARDPALRRLAARAGPALARRFLRLVPGPLPSSPLDQLFDHAAGAYFARRLGQRPSPRYMQKLTTAFRNAPLPARNSGRSLADPARRLLDDLVDWYFPHKLHLPTPEPYANLVRRAAAYPFRVRKGQTAAQLEDQIYLATHVVYVLSDFNESHLGGLRLSRLVRFLERVGPLLLRADDIETLGEVGDALKILGRGYSHPLIRKIVSRLMARQNPDGSWGAINDHDRYRRYHTTWTCFNGLLEYRFRQRGVTDPVIRRAWRQGRRGRQSEAMGRGDDRAPRRPAPEAMTR